MDNGTNADIVVIGGGILGASIAWHLARAGVRDVLAIERNAVGSGATSRSAGLVSRGRTDPDIFAMVGRTAAAVAELESDLGETVGFHRTGSLRLAEAPETAEGLQRMHALLTADRVAAHFIDAGKAHAMVPWLNAGRARSILHVPNDGYVDAYLLTAAYARAARAAGATFWTGVAVTGLARDGDRVTGVETDRGRVGCHWAVDAAGAWAGLVAGWLGLALGATPVRSHYWITAPDPRLPRDHPVVSLPDARAYLRPEVGGLLMGVQEPTSRTFDARRLPADVAEMSLIGDDDWDLLIEHAATLKGYIPRLDDFEFAHHIAGLATYTPDGRFLIGPYPGVDGFLVAAGCCGTGVSVSGGIGLAVADIVLGREASVDLERFRPDRFGPFDPYSAAFMARCAAARGNKGRRA